MALADLLQQDAIIPALKVNSKKQLLQELAAKASKLTGVAEREIFDVILQRERLGSTGVGHGVAIPHGKLSSISSISGVFARLETPVDFEALDDQPVDRGLRAVDHAAEQPEHQRVNERRCKQRAAGKQ